MSPKDEEDYGVQGCHGTIAPQQDEAYYDDRSDASDDIEKGRLHFPKRLYGRERELETLMNIYNDAAVTVGASSIKNGDTQLSNVSEEKDEPPAQDASSEDSYYSSRVVFLSGYSGIGKSALVNEFVKQAEMKYNDILYASGKYTEQSSASAPFSAITEVLDKLVLDITKTEEQHKLVSDGIKESELIGPDTEGNRILQTTFPSLSAILSDEKVSTSSTTAAHPSMDAIKECTRELLSIICTTLTHPIIILLDDVQWADEASIDMLLLLLSSTKIRIDQKCIMFICAYRSNEVDEDHPFTKLMNDVTEKRESKSIEQMDLFNLSPEAITGFIADTIKREEEDGGGDDNDNEGVRELSEAVYKKTMGNIFFTMQALEELVRKNVLFYDIMCFEWRFVVSKVELEDHMSDDVVTMVKNKIGDLSTDIQHLLTVMSYIPNAVDVSILMLLLSYGDVSYDENTVKKLLKKAAEEGMLLLSNDSKCYIFAHDRIRQASHDVAAENHQSDLVLHISRVLQDVAKQKPGMEWCLYVATDLLNSLPPEKTANLDLVELNMRVAKIARSRGSVGKENELLHKALTCLESSGKIWKEYKQTLELHNAVIVSDHSLGAYSTAKLSIQNVLNKAFSMIDKLHAHIYQMLCNIGETSDYTKGLNDGLALLKLYGFDIPKDISKAYMTKEEMKMKMALKGRSYSCLTKLSVNDESAGIGRLFSEVQVYAMYNGHEKHVQILAWRAIQHAIKSRIHSHRLPSIVVLLASSMARQGKVKTAQELGNVSLALCDKIRGDMEICALTRMLAYHTVLLQLQSFRSSLDTLLQCHKDMKLVGGMTEAMFGAMLGYFQAYIAGGLELGPILESKLICVEDLCRDLNSAGFLTTFQITRQFALNLRTRKEEPTKFLGDAFHEEEELSKKNENARKMAIRDSSAARLQLAFVFWDEDVMVQMLNNLKDYPLSDSSLPRLHNRLCFVGLAAYGLGTRQGCEAYLKLKQDYLNYFEHLTKLGSVNAKPIYLFMRALKSPSDKSFMKAIDACTEAGLIQLEAMARERYATFLTKENEVGHANEQIKTSYWKYQDWGAFAKALQMVEQYAFLRSSTRKKTNTVTSSEHSGKKGKMIVNNHAR